MPFCAEFVKSLTPITQSTQLPHDDYLRFYKLDLAPRFKGLEMRIGVFQAAGYRLVAQSFKPPHARGTLVLLHGYYDHVGLYGHLIEWALSQGFAVIACDLPGHGLSDGPRASIQDFTQYQDVLTGLLQQACDLALPSPWHLCGQSTGAAIALDHVLHRPDKALGRSILLAPLVRPRAWRRSQLSYQLLKPWVQQIPRRFSDNSSDHQFITFVRHHDPLQPKVLPTAWVGALGRWIKRIEKAQASQHHALIVQGEADQTVAWTHNLKVLKQKLPHADVLMLPTARHHLVNEVASIREHYLAFLGKALSEV